MKINDRELAELCTGEVAIEGRLHHRKVTGNFAQSGFKEKWFKLRANILFFFNFNEPGKNIYDKKPTGAMILENAIVQYEMHADTPFAFSIAFHDEIDKKHMFSGRSEDYINLWVSLLKQASYEYWRSQLILLQSKIRLMTGKDPLLMYPRNEGSKVFPLDEKPQENKETHRVSTKRQPSSKSSSFRSYVPSAIPDNSSQKTIGAVFDLNQTNFTNGLDLIGSEVKAVIKPIPPPVRPARSPRMPRPNCVNLIDL